jgi:dTDP-4-dehydrorhamnose 3,5-epimerase
MLKELKKIKISTLPLLGLKLIQPELFPDQRGYFLESFRKELYQALALPDFVQDNRAFSQKNVLRGMHFQKGQAKLVSVAFGKIFDVAVDIRKNSQTFGRWQSVILDDQSCQQFFIPDGFAHGYLVLSETAVVTYKVSSYYDPKKEKGFSCRDPEVAIDWPAKSPVLSLKDMQSPLLKEVIL